MKRDDFVCGYAACIADLYRLDGGSSVRAGELLQTLGGVRNAKGKGVERSDMNILRAIERAEGTAIHAEMDAPPTEQKEAGE